MNTYKARGVLVSGSGNGYSIVFFEGDFLFYLYYITKLGVIPLVFVLVTLASHVKFLYTFRFDVFYFSQCLTRLHLNYVFLRKRVSLWAGLPISVQCFGL